MYSLSQLLAACLLSVVFSAVAAWMVAASRAGRALDAEREQHEQQLRALREEYATDLRELQHSLGSEVAQLRERVRNPLRTLVDSFMN